MATDSNYLFIHVPSLPQPQGLDYIPLEGETAKDMTELAAKLKSVESIIYILRRLL